jgi:hypothetical protein
LRYCFVISVAGSELRALVWPFVPWVTTTPLLQSAAITRPLAKTLDTLFNNMVSSRPRLDDAAHGYTHTTARRAAWHAFIAP